MSQLAPARTENHASGTEDQDVEMAQEVQSSFRFLQSKYAQEEITAMRNIWETGYGFLAQLRKPSDMENKVVKGLIEGTILCAKLPDFLKRICTNEALRKTQNTIQAQVEGDLILKLQADFPVYPDFQARARLVGMITVGLQHGRRDKDKVISLLKEAKQVYYDRNLHAVHIIFWTRELAAKCSRELHSLPFRNRTFTLRNEHEAMENPTEADWLGLQAVRQRQIGAGGQKNED
ncbi:hypothetical protein PI124_g24186 [Phytophthora idaei]|nr:hypothetical protein PI124_g24186 [Phytophthora idaei]